MKDAPRIADLTAESAEEHATLTVQEPESGLWATTAILIGVGDGVDPGEYGDVLAYQDLIGLVKVGGDLHSHTMGDPGGAFGARDDVPSINSYLPLPSHGRLALTSRAQRTTTPIWLSRTLERSLLLAQRLAQRRSATVPCKQRQFGRSER